MRKIAVVITARPSYSRIKTALHAIKDHSDLELCLIVAGSALLNRYGSAVDYIEKDGFEIAAKVYNVLEGGTLVSQSKTTGLGIIELTNVFQQQHPDAVVTIADRYETLATAIAASYMNIPLVHIQGGEVTGNIDEKVRHAITKLADLHLVSSEDAYRRVISLGEEEQKVHITGCPSIDLAAEMGAGGLDFDPYERYGGVGGAPSLEKGYIVVLQHPVTTEYENAREQARITLEAVSERTLPTLWFWPNVDAGSDGTSNAIRSYRELNNSDHLHFFKNMKPEDFLKLINSSEVLVGNSSVGIREASYLGVPVVNIGSRQEGRLRGENVVDVSYDRKQIADALEMQAGKKYEKETIYGDGSAGRKIAEILSKATLTYHKKITF